MSSISLSERHMSSALERRRRDVIAFIGLPFQVVPRCPGEIGLLVANSCCKSSSLLVRAIHDPKSMDFRPLPPPPEVQGVSPGCKESRVNPGKSWHEK